jgi:hypothetical protein
MSTNFIVHALQANAFKNLFDLDNVSLEKLGIKRMIVDEYPGFPCRVSLEDAQLGEEVLLLPYPHHQTNSPYQASGPIFVRKIAATANLAINEIPKMLHHRLLSLRGYDVHGMMKAAVVVQGENLKEQIQQFFVDEEINYIHIHNAKPGCYNCVVKKAS